MTTDALGRTMPPERFGAARTLVVGWDVDGQPISYLLAYGMYRLGVNGSNIPGATVGAARLVAAGTANTATVDQWPALFRNELAAQSRSRPGAGGETTVVSRDVAQFLLDAAERAGAVAALRSAADDLRGAVAAASAAGERKFSVPSWLRARAKALSDQTDSVGT